jgi:hypothetical protein
MRFGARLARRKRGYAVSSCLAKALVQKSLRLAHQLVPVWPRLDAAPIKIHACHMTARAGSPKSSPKGPPWMQETNPSSYCGSAVTRPAMSRDGAKAAMRKIPVASNAVLRLMEFRWKGNQPNP